MEALVVTVIAVVFMFCKVCGKHTKHHVQKDSEYWDTYWCESCHIGQKVKTK